MIDEANKDEVNAAIQGDPYGQPDALIEVPEEPERTKPEIALDASQQVFVSRWMTVLSGQPATPVEEHEMLEAVGADPALRDYLVVGLLHGWLGQEIDGVPNALPIDAAERLEETLGRCRDNTPEKATCEVLLFTAKLGEQMKRSADYMTALSWMSDEDVQMLVDAGTHATTEMSAYVDVLVQSIAVTKVAR